MSNMIRPQGGPPMGGAPPGGPPGGGVQSKMSMFNPPDVAAKASNGSIRPGQTVGEFLQRNFGVSPQDPVEKFMQAIKSQAKNATVPGKMGMPPGGPPQQAPQGRPPMGGSPGGAPPAGPGGLDSLIGKM